MVKKILFFTGGSYVAGLEIVTLQLIKGLKERGYDVRCVVNGWNDGDFKNRLVNMGVPYYEVKLGWLYLTKPAWTLDTLINYPGAYSRCRKVIKEFKPDVFHFTSYHMALMLYPLIGKHSFFTLHDTQLPNRKHLFIYGLLNKRIKIFVAVSGLIHTTLEKMKIPSGKIRIIYNGVEDEGCPAGNDSESGNAVRFAIAGQVAEWKGHELLVKAAELLVKDGVQHFNIAIIGKNDNAYSEKLMAMIEEKKLVSFFTWRGFVRDRSAVYNGIDVVVVPSMSTASKYFEESFSLSTAEGMIRGLAVIASNKGGMKELIDHGQNGLLFTEGDPAALYACMKKVITNKELIPFLGANAITKARANFTDTVMTDRYIAVYNESHKLTNE